MMRKVGRILLGVLVVGAALFAVLCVLKLVWDAQFYDDYVSNAPLNVVVREEENRNGYRRVEFTFDGVPGNPVPAVLALPKKEPGPFPGLVFLHGIGQKKEFLDEIAKYFVDAGYAIATFDQYMQGERKLKDANPVERALAFRRRAALTTIEARRMVDYLETRPDIAKDQIFLLGASYGAITGTAAAAFDNRIRGVVLCYGGGNIRKLIDSEAAREAAGPAIGAVKWFLAWLLAPADPVRHVAAISPRPILIQGGRRDRIVPPAAVQALIDAAKEPKDVIWYDSDHVGLDEEHTVKVLKDSIAWLDDHRAH